MGESAIINPRAAAAPRRWAFSVPQLLTLVTMATLAPLILFGAGALFLWDRNERRADVARLSAHAEALAQAVDREVRGYREIVEGLASSPDLRSRQTASFWDFAQSVARHLGGHFALIDPTMQQVVNTSRPAGSPLPSARSTNEIKRAFESGSTIITNYEQRSVTGRKQFTILAPVRESGQVQYVLGYAPPTDAIQGVLKETYRPEGWFAAVLDQNGTIVARSRDYDEFFGRPAAASFIARINDSSGNIQSRDLQGRASTTSWHTARDGWKIIVWAPKDVLEQRTGYIVQALGLTALAAILMSLLASWLASRLIQGPAQRLVHAARGLGEGQTVKFAPTAMKEANAVGASLSEASELILRREADLIASQAHTNLIMRELSHRSKNLLALVQAIARQSARASSSFADFQPRFIERLQSLSMSHDLLIKTDWTSVSIKDLLSEQMRTFIDNPDTRLKMTGEHLMLKPEAAQNLGMVFHELGSNAVKHGSLSSPTGVVHVKWRIENDPTPMLSLRWREEGGPAVHAPTSRGFGTIIIEKLIPQSLHGKAETAWDAEGFSWTLHAPMESIARAGKPATGAHDL
ncbi:MAG: sensor histidine kinase [Beijerinckiaceae bacterium]|nr:sensor histidine kinase [Beijerinckiaceae bacterium]